MARKTSRLPAHEMRKYNLEHDAQAAVFTWAKLAESRFPELALLFAIPNGGHRHIAVAKKMQLEGVKSGVPDMCLPVARQGFHGLFIEMKSADSRPKRPGSKGPLSEEQRRWLQALNDQGYRAAVCFGSQEAIDLLTQYLSQ